MKLNDQVIVQKLGDTCVVYDNNKSVLHEFNRVGFLIIEAIEEGTSRKKIVSKIVDKFEVSKNQAEEDLEEFLKELKSKDLITL